MLAAYRASLTNALADPEGVWVVHDAVFPKKGRHSVGVHRQYARALGRKVNCQIAVVLGQIGTAGYLPLAGRLYLPAHWLRENRELVERTVPEEFRGPVSKAAVALALIDEVLAEGRRPGRGLLVLEGGYTGPDLADGLAARGLSSDENGRPDLLAAAMARFDELRSALGLDHFEGRSWTGWHHHLALVFTAFAFFRERGASPWPRSLA